MSDAVILAIVAVASSLVTVIGAKVVDGWLTRGRNVHEDTVSEKVALRARVEKLEATCETLQVRHVADLDRMRGDHVTELGKIRSDLWDCKEARVSATAEIHILKAEIHRLQGEIEEIGVERHEFANRVTSAELKLQRMERVALKNGWGLINGPDVVASDQGGSS